jgi:hypothetical protein
VNENRLTVEDADAGRALPPRMRRLSTLGKVHARCVEPNRSSPDATEIKQWRSPSHESGGAR